MSETRLRSGVFAAAIALAAGLQRLAPHARSRGSWLVNGALAVMPLRRAA